MVNLRCLIKVMLAKGVSVWCGLAYRCLGRHLSGRKLVSPSPSSSSFFPGLGRLSGVERERHPYGQSRYGQAGRCWLWLRRPYPAFTLLESLLTLAVTSFLVLILAGQVQAVFRSVQTHLFLLSFEQLYKDSQQLALSQAAPVTVAFSEAEISNGYQAVAVPAGLTLTGPERLELASNGGNHSLAKVTFTWDEARVDYQFYLGSGRYKKTRN